MQKVELWEGPNRSYHYSLPAENYRRETYGVVEDLSAATIGLYYRKILHKGKVQEYFKLDYCTDLASFKVILQVTLFGKKKCKLLLCIKYRDIPAASL